MRLGIDVGGTNTDAVLMDGLDILGSVKAPTTADVTSGIIAATKDAVAKAGVDPATILAVMIGTTHFTNAIVERRRLSKVAAIRMGAPATTALPPMIDWPESLTQQIHGQTHFCAGGFEFDGREISKLDPGELRRISEQIGTAGIPAVSIASVFSPVNAEFEEEACRLLLEDHPDLHVSCSHELGRIGLLERENATILNAALQPLAGQMMHSFEGALREVGITAPFFVSQNDGTLVHAEFAARYPVITFASGPTNSMRGAAFLSGQEDCAVVDIGGTTSDIGVLHGGFPRESRVTASIGGVRTNLRMPDILPIGIGGGSLVSLGREVAVGPESVGHELSRSKVFGGDQLTATDLAVAAGRLELGDPKLAAEIDGATVKAGLAAIASKIAETVDRMKTSPDAIPVVVVGGGGVLLDGALEGASELIRPDHSSVANAIGAAIAEIGSEVERVYSLDNISREDAVQQVKDDAAEKAVAAGAAPGSVRIVDVDEIALAYMPRNAVRVKVRAVGNLELERLVASVARDN